LNLRNNTFSQIFPNSAPDRFLFGFYARHYDNAIRLESMRERAFSPAGCVGCALRTIRPTLNFGYREKIVNYEHASGNNSLPVLWCASAPYRTLQAQRSNPNVNLVLIPGQAARGGCHSFEKSGRIDKYYAAV